MLKKEKAMSVVALTAKMRELTLSAQENSPHNHFNTLSTLIYQSYFPAILQTPPRVTIYSDGNLITVSRGKRKILSSNPIKRVNDWYRGKIQTFTPSSRLRLMRKLNMMDTSVLPYFVTLTYPSEYPAEPKLWKKHLKNFASRMERVFPEAGFFWRLEFQRRGAPHYHLLVYGADGDFQDWLSTAWYNIVGSDDENHQKQGVFVLKTKNYPHLTGYFGKMSKPSDVEHCGRYWGAYHKENLKRYMSEEVTFEVTEKLACQLIRYFRKLSGIKSRAYPSLTIFGDGEFWVAVLRKMLDPEEHTPGELRSPIFMRNWR